MSPTLPCGPTTGVYWLGIGAMSLWIGVMVCLARGYFRIMSLLPSGLCNDFYCWPQEEEEPVKTEENLDLSTSSETDLSFSDGDNDQYRSAISSGCSIGSIQLTDSTLPPSV